jgi:hypothetical protein
MDPPSRIEDAAEIERTYPRQARTPFNVTGHPALAMMAGLSSGGLPLSVQFVGRNFAQATLFRVARAWERAAGDTASTQKTDGTDAPRRDPPSIALQRWGSILCRHSHRSSASSNPLKSGPAI